MLVLRCLGCSLLLTAALSAHSAETAFALEVLVEPTCPSVAPPLETQSAIGVLLAEGLLSSLTGSAVDAAGAYFAGATMTKSVAFKGSVNDTFYTLDGNGDLSLRANSGCLVLVVPGDAAMKPWFEVARSRSKALMSFDKLPQFYFEAAFERSAGVAPTLAVRSKFLHIGSFQETGWSYRDDRNYAVALTLRNREDDQPFGVATFSFDRIRPSTRGESQTIKFKSDGSKVVDPSIEASLNPANDSQRVAFFPSTPTIEAAVKIQKLVAAPYNKAAQLTNKDTQEPLLGEPEWSVRSAAAKSAAQNFVTRLSAFCDSLERLKDKKPDLPEDARCPVAHLQAVNDLEEARDALKMQMETEWASKFVQLHLGTCKKDNQGKVACAAPPPKQSAYGPFTWEATVVETREPNAFAKAVASAFASNKDKLKADLQNELIPSKREEVKQKAESTERDALVALRLAMLKVEEAEARLLEAVNQPRSAQLVLQAEVLQAKVAANNAARVAGRVAPFEI